MSDNTLKLGVNSPYSDILFKNSKYNCACETGSWQQQVAVVMVLMLIQIAEQGPGPGTGDQAGMQNSVQRKSRPPLSGQPVHCSKTSIFSFYRIEDRFYRVSKSNPTLVCEYPWDFEGI